MSGLTPLQINEWITCYKERSLWLTAISPCKILHHGIIQDYHQALDFPASRTWSLNKPTFFMTPPNLWSQWYSNGRQVPIMHYELSVSTDVSLQSLVWKGPYDCSTRKKLRYIHQLQTKPRQLSLLGLPKCHCIYTKVKK